jgi:hypothetical protein
MSAIILLLALALGRAQPDTPVTDAEKTEFLKVLATLPTRGESFTDDGITKKERVIRAYERARQTKVELVKQHTLDAIPPGEVMFEYSKQSCAFAPDQPLLYACRPDKQQGQLITYNIAGGSTSRLAIPQPEGFKAQFRFLSYFEHPALSINSRGDLLCRWTLRGNGDHALALLKKGAGSFQVARVELPLLDRLVVAEPEGAWYLIHGAPRFAIDQINGNLKLTRLGDFAGKGHHTLRIVDARFISQDVLHLFWGMSSL